MMHHMFSKKVSYKFIRWKPETVSYRMAFLSLLPAIEIILIQLILKTRQVCRERYSIQLWPCDVNRHSG